MVPNRPIPRPTPGTGMTPPVNPGTMGGGPSEGIAPGMDDTGAGQKYYDRPIGSYQYGGMVPNQPINPRFRYGFGNRMGGGPRPGMRPGMGTPRPMGGGMNPAQKRALMKRFAKFKKVIV